LAFPILCDDKPVQSEKADFHAALDRWVLEKNFTRTGISIQSLANEIGTNRTYLSNHINGEKGMNFNHWISNLRIEESMRILINNPELSIDQVSERVGYSEQSNFTSHFTQIVGI
jgi:AraC-like DNA-binding protein